MNSLFFESFYQPLVLLKIVSAPIPCTNRTPLKPELFIWACKYSPSKYINLHKLLLLLLICYELQYFVFPLLRQEGTCPHLITSASKQILAKTHKILLFPLGKQCQTQWPLLPFISMNHKFTLPLDIINGLSHKVLVKTSFHFCKKGRHE